MQICHCIIINHFSINLLCITAPCGDTIIRLSPGNSNGVLTSVNFPDNYDNGMLCNWFITSRISTRILLEFVEIDVEYSYDDIFVGEGNDDGNFSSILLSITGKRPPLSIASPINALWIKFTSDYIVTGGGFKLQYSTLERESMYSFPLLQMLHSNTSIYHVLKLLLPITLNNK